MRFSLHASSRLYLNASLSVFNCLFLIAALAPFARAQEPAPAVALDDSAAEEPADDRGAAFIEYEPDGRYVAYTNFLKILRSIDPASRSEWDSISGVLSVAAEGRSLRALSARPFIIIDGKSQVADKPLRVKSGVVLIPVATVKILLQAIDPAYVLALPSDAARSPAPSPAPEEGDPESATPAPAEETSMPLPTGALLGSTADYAPPPLEAPPGLPNQQGLNWKALADRAHRNAPARGAIICDAELRPLAGRVMEILSASLRAEVTILPVGARRSGSVAATQISIERPEFVIDLMSAPAGSGGDAASERVIEVWTVHEALWPGDAAASPPPAYRRHQFQNIALGAMVRGELARNFAAGSVRFSLAPLHLLRRADAPSVAALIPEKMAREGSSDAGLLSRAIAAGVVSYFKGIQSGSGR